MFVLWIDGGSKHNGTENEGYGTIKAFLGTSFLGEWAFDFENTPSNMAEMKTAICALKLIADNEIIMNNEVTIKTDSQNVIGWITKNWKARAFPELVETAKSLFNEKIVFEKVPRDEIVAMLGH